MQSGRRRLGSGQVGHVQRGVPAVPLLTAIRRTEPTVLLIDETDKADIEIEGLLLEVLSDFAVTVPSWAPSPPRRNPVRGTHLERHPRVVRGAQASLPVPAHRLPHPDLERRILLSRVPELPESLAAELVRIIGVLRGMQLQEICRRWPRRSTGDAAPCWPWAWTPSTTPPSPRRWVWCSNTSPTSSAAGELRLN